MWLGTLDSAYTSICRNTMRNMTLASDVSFLALALPRWRRLTKQMKKVVYADIISIGCLVLACHSV